MHFGKHLKKIFTIDKIMSMGHCYLSQLKKNTHALETWCMVIVA